MTWAPTRSGVGRYAAQLQHCCLYGLRGSALREGRALGHAALDDIPSSAKTIIVVGYLWFLKYWALEYLQTYSNDGFGSQWQKMAG